MPALMAILQASVAQLSGVDHAAATAGTVLVAPAEPCSSITFLTSDKRPSPWARCQLVPARSRPLCQACATVAVGLLAPARCLPSPCPDVVPRRCFQVGPTGAGLACCPGKVDLYQPGELVHPRWTGGPAGHVVHLLPCDGRRSAKYIASGERRWSVRGSPRPSCEFPGADPATRRSAFRSPASPELGLREALRPVPYAARRRCSSGRTFRSGRCPSTTGFRSRRCRSHSREVTSTWVRE